MLVQKEKNVVKIRFDDESYIITPSLKQWDKGQIIQFLDIDDGAIVQFGTNGNSYVQNGQVEIPDFLMEKEGQTIIYVRFIDENSETTVKKVIIPINPKDKPKDYIEPENEQSFIQQVTEIMNSTKAVADSVREDADNGDFDGYTPIKGTDYFTREEIEEIEDEAARKVDLSGLVPNSRKIGDESLDSDITKDKLGREVTKAFVAGGSWYGMLIPWLISQCGSKTQQDTNVAEIQSLKLTSGNKLALSIDTTNYVMTIALQNSDGTVLDEKSIDFPLESVVISGLYDAENKQVVLTLQNGSEIRFSVSDLVNGLVSEDQLTEGLDEKVDKVTGKGLSTNDFTNEYKALLDFRITKQPEDIYGALYGVRNISIEAVGNNLSYQWQLSNDNGTTWIDSTSTGYNTDTLTVTIGNTQFNGRLYRCQVTDADNNVLYSDTCMCIIKSSFASIAQIKAGTENINTIVPANQFQAVFYGMAKAAGDTTQSQSSNPVGTYTDEAKEAIQQMIGILSSEGVGF